MGTFRQNGAKKMNKTFIFTTADRIEFGISQLGVLQLPPPPPLLRSNVGIDGIDSDMRFSLLTGSLKA